MFKHLHSNLTLYFFFIIINKFYFVIYFFENMATAFFNISTSCSNSLFFFCSLRISSLFVFSPVDVVIVLNFFIQPSIVLFPTPYSLDNSDTPLPFSYNFTTVFFCIYKWCHINCHTTISIKFLISPY